VLADRAFNTKKAPFDDARVRQALSLAIDRYTGAEALSRIALVRHVGGLLRPGYELAASDEEMEEWLGFSRDIEASREEGPQLLAEAGQENLSFTFTNRNVAMPYTPVGVFLIDQWRQIGVTAEHEQLETRLYQAKLRGEELEAGLDFHCDYMDEPNLQLIKYISADLAHQLFRLQQSEDGRAVRAAGARTRYRQAQGDHPRDGEPSRWRRPTTSRPSGGTASSCITTSSRTGTSRPATTSTRTSPSLAGAVSTPMGADSRNDRQLN
jgi:hypothetical protein